MITKIGNKDYLEAGSCISHLGEDIVIEFRGLKFSFKFIEVPSIATPSVSVKGDGMHAEFTFTNHNMGTGHMNTVPFPIGTLDNRRLFFNYVVYGFGTPSIGKLFHYTFMLGENA